MNEIIIIQSITFNPFIGLQILWDFLYKDQQNFSQASGGRSLFHQDQPFGLKQCIYHNNSDINRIKTKRKGYTGDIYSELRH